MRTIKHIWLFLSFCALAYSAVSQVDNPEFSSDVEPASDERRLEMYVDSIDKYLYRDSEIAKEYMQRMDNVLETNPSVPDSIVVLYLKNKVLFHHNQGNPVQAFQIYAEARNEIYAEGIPVSLRFSMKYLEGFTLMELGDLDAAQKLFYQNIIDGKELNNLGIVSSNLYSLGQLYTDDGKYETALETFEELISLKNKLELRPSTWVLTHSEIAETYEGMELYSKALIEIQKSIEIADSNKINVLKTHVSTFKGEMYLKLNQIPLAQELYDDLSRTSQNEKDVKTDLELQKFHAMLLLAKEDYDGALKIYNDLIEDTDTTDISELMDIHDALHDVSVQKKDDKMAYKHLLEYNKLNQQRQDDERSQNTEYLRVRYESEQKEAHNKLLASQLDSSQLKTSVLYLVSGIFLLLLGFLFVLVYQSRRQRRLLKEEVNKRTLSLQQSNDMLKQSNIELDEFNRILSHDLKEPIRNIVSYGQMIAHAEVAKEEVLGYSDIIKNSGVQLYNLIENVGQYQEIQKKTLTQPVPSDIKKLLDNALQEVQAKHMGKAVITTIGEMPIVKTHPSEVTLVFYHLIENSFVHNSSDSPTLNISYFENVNFHIIEISDNGVGIPEQYQEYVFGMFKRLNKREEYRGSGLGLSITKKILTKIGGDVKLMKADNHDGTTIQVLLPKA